MNVKDAIARAKVYAQDVFNDEKVSNLGVEEVERDGDLWQITLGLSRPWDNPGSMLSTMIPDPKPANRSYHVFTIDDKEGKTINVRLRDR